MITWIYAFHMPLFVFISGWFFKKRTVKEELLKGYKGLLVPWLIFCVTNFIIATSQVILTAHNLSGITDYVLPFNSRSYVFFHTIWFLPCLFMVRLLYNVLYNLYGSKSFGIAFLCYAIAYLLGSKDIELPFFIDSTLGLVIFYALGHMIAKSKAIKIFQFNTKSNMRTFVTMVLCGGIFALSVSILHPETDWKYNTFEWYNVLLSMFGIIFILCVSHLINHFLSDKTKRTFAYLGTSSLVIMGLHHPLYDFYGIPFLNMLGVPKQMWFILMLLVIMPITLLVGNKILYIDKLTKHKKVNH